MMEEIYPQYQETTTDDHALQAPLGSGMRAYRKPMPQEDDSPQSTVSISLSVSAVEMAGRLGASGKHDRPRAIR